jgi:hypothetical protein
VRRAPMSPVNSRWSASPAPANAGHYPLEEPGLTQMQDAIAEFDTTNTQGQTGVTHSATH